MTRLCDIEEMSFETRILCVSHKPLETTRALLNLLERGLMQTLEEMLHLPGARGGRHRLDPRKYGLVNLATAWHKLGRQPTSGAKSEFVAFSEAIPLEKPEPKIQSVKQTDWTLFAVRHHQTQLD
jgi:hypothetical protein